MHLHMELQFQERNIPVSQISDENCHPSRAISRTDASKPRMKTRMGCPCIPLTGRDPLAVVGFFKSQNSYNMLLTIYKVIVYVICFLQTLWTHLRFLR